MPIGKISKLPEIKDFVTTAETYDKAFGLADNGYNIGGGIRNIKK